MRELPHAQGFFVNPADGRVYTDYTCTKLCAGLDGDRSWLRYWDSHLSTRGQTRTDAGGSSIEPMTEELKPTIDTLSPTVAREATRAHTVLTSLVTEIRTSSPNVLNPMEIAEGVDLLRHFLTPSQSELALADNEYVNTRQNLALTLISLTYDMSVSEKSKLAVRLLGIGAGIGRRT